MRTHTAWEGPTLAAIAELAHLASLGHHRAPSARPESITTPLGCQVQFLFRAPFAQRELLL